MGGWGGREEGEGKGEGGWGEERRSRGERRGGREGGKQEKAESGC